MKSNRRTQNTSSKERESDFNIFELLDRELREMRWRLDVMLKLLKRANSGRRGRRRSGEQPLR